MYLHVNLSTPQRVEQHPRQDESGEGAGPRSSHLSQSAVSSADILKKAVLQLKALSMNFIFYP